MVSGLLPLLNDSRVIFLSSAGHAQAPLGGVDYNSVVRNGEDSVQEARDRQPNVWVDYGQSKWGDIALAKQLDKLHGPSSGGSIISISIHPGRCRLLSPSRPAHSYSPGMVATNLASHFSITAPLLRWLPWLVVRSPALHCLSKLSLTHAANHHSSINCRGDQPTLGRDLSDGRGQTPVRFLHCTLPDHRQTTSRSTRRRKMAEDVGLVRATRQETHLSYHLDAHMYMSECRKTSQRAMRPTD